MPRVVSLIASATEIVHVIGCGDQLVGRSHECDFPETVKRLPVCTGPRINVYADSRTIDADIKSALRDGLSVYHVDAAKLRELKPDVILTQTQCEVCAVSQRDVELALGDWIGAWPRVVSLAPNALDDVWTDIVAVADELDAPERGIQVAAEMRRRLASIAHTARSLPARPAVACIEWIDPLMAAGNWVPELVEMSGGVNLFGEAGKHSPWMTWEKLVAADPEVIALMPCGFDIERTRQDVPLLACRPGWSTLRAVKDNRVYVCDGNQYFNRPGPRLVESLEILAEMLHPEVFRFGHEGTGWVRES